jgi:hypothetical protein
MLKLYVLRNLALYRTQSELRFIPGRRVLQATRLKLRSNAIRTHKRNVLEQYCFSHTGLQSQDQIHTC